MAKIIDNGDNLGSTIRCKIKFSQKASYSYVAKITIMVNIVNVCSKNKCMWTAGEKHEIIK